MNFRKHMGTMFVHQIEFMSKIRMQILVACVVAFIGTALLWFMPNSPFPFTFCLVTGFSAVFHFFIFIIFKKIQPAHVVFVLVMNVVLTPFIVHLSGGIASPFMLLFSSILLTALLFGMRSTTSLAIVIIPYLVVIMLEYWGILLPPTLSAATIYQSGLA
ncbi:MAG TPA: hypothetical protein VJC18_05160, partial [bacterium]|nr:hypothetical protein [bacterium]